MLIKEAFRADKHFILAKMKTRSTNAFTQSHSHFFNAYGILRLIFKKRQEDIVGRFHHKYPMSAKNPLTNNVSAIYIVNCLVNHWRSRVFHSQKPILVPAS